MLYKLFLRAALPLIGGDRFAALRRFEHCRRLLRQPGVDARAIRIAYVGAPVPGRFLGFRRFIGKPVRRFGASQYRRAGALALYSVLTDVHTVALLVGFTVLTVYI